MFYAIAQINLLINMSFSRHIEAVDLCDFFGEYKLTLLDKVIYIMRTLNADRLDERYTTKEVIHKAPHIDYSQIDDEIDILYSEGDKIVLDHRGTWHSILNKQTTLHTLDITIPYGSKDFPTVTLNIDLHHVLTNLKEESDINKIISENLLISGFSKDQLIELLLEHDLATLIEDDESNIEKLTSDKLSKLLQDNGINAFGKKKKLVKLVKKQIPKDKYHSDSYERTEEGKEEIKSDE